MPHSGSIATVTATATTHLQQQRAMLAPQAVGCPTKTDTAVLTQTAMVTLTPIQDGRSLQIMQMPLFLMLRSGLMETAMDTVITQLETIPMRALQRRAPPQNSVDSAVQTATVMVTLTSMMPSQASPRNGATPMVTDTAMKPLASKGTHVLPRPVLRPVTASVAPIRTAMALRTTTVPGRSVTEPMLIQAIRPNGPIPTATDTVTTRLEQTATNAQHSQAIPHKIAWAAPIQTATDTQTQIHCGPSMTELMPTPTIRRDGATVTQTAMTTDWTMTVLPSLALQCTTEKDALTKTVMAIQIPTPRGQPTTGPMLS